MRRLVVALVIVFVLVTVACSPEPTPEPTAEATVAEPMVTVVLTIAPPEPTPTPTLVPTPIMNATVDSPAPEEAFADVGSIARFSSDDDAVMGRAILAGLQTLIIRDFSYQVDCTGADIRLGKEGTFDQPSAVLIDLEEREYTLEMMVLSLPPEVNADNTDSIALYCEETGEVLGWGTFRYKATNASSSS